MSLLGEDETVLVTVDIPEAYRRLINETGQTLFSRARFADDTEAGVRLHMVARVEGSEGLWSGIVELRIGKFPERLATGDVFELVAGGRCVVRCTVAED